MEPNDLKNPNGLNSTESSDAKNADKESAGDTPNSDGEIKPEDNKEKNEAISSDEDAAAKKENNTEVSESTSSGKVTNQEKEENIASEENAESEPLKEIKETKKKATKESKAPEKETEKEDKKEVEKPAGKDLKQDAAEEVVAEDEEFEKEVEKKEEEKPSEKDLNQDAAKEVVAKEKAPEKEVEKKEEEKPSEKDLNQDAAEELVAKEKAPEKEVKKKEEEKPSEKDLSQDAPKEVVAKEKAPEKEVEKKEEEKPSEKDLKQDAVEEVDVEDEASEKEVERKEKNEAEKPSEKEIKQDAEEVVAAEKDETSETEPEKKEKKSSKKEVRKQEKSGDKAPKEEKRIQIDYTNFSQINLVNSFREVLDNPKDYDVKEEIEKIKAVFYKNLNDNIEEANKKFIDEGGAEEDFIAPEDPYEKDLKDLLRRYRQYRIEQNKQLEREKEDNLTLKYQIIEEIKALINNEESINKTFNEFRDLQRKWREVGLVPQSKMKNLWDTYHFHVENFYNYIKINRELRDLDLKKNLEAKLNLCERAEELLLEPSIIKAFNTLQKYHEQWREIGPVPIEQKDDIWERFKAATSKINKKHQEFFENRKTEQKKNLDAKTVLCEKVEEILAIEISSHKEWDEKSREMIELQKVWRTIGFAPRKDNNKIYERFRGACDKFFDAKRAFYSKNKELQQNNLQLKIDMCAEAEAMKDSTDWKKTTHDFIKLQKRWKESGPVPRKQSDQVWKRFRAACDYFFEKKSEHYSSLDSEQVDNLKKKEELIAEINAFKPSENMDENLNSLKDFQRRWTEIGHVPFKKKDEVQHNYRESINKLYDVLNLDDEKRNMLKFKTKMNTFSESNRGQNKMRYEREKYMNKLKQLENDLVLLDNNVGFFAKSKNAESLIADVQKKIEDTKQKIENIKEKIRVIDKLDKSD